MRRPTNTDINQLWARWCALQVLDLWQPRERYPQPTAVRCWLDTADEGVRPFARTSCRVYLDNNQGDVTRRWAAFSTYFALVINEESQHDPNSAAQSAASSASTALLAAKIKPPSFQTVLSRIHALCDIPPTLADLRSDEAWKDPWLMREVWRMLRLPDFEIVCDWYNKIQQQLEETS